MEKKVIIFGPNMSSPMHSDKKGKILLFSVKD